MRLVSGSPRVESGGYSCYCDFGKSLLNTTTRLLSSQIFYWWKVSKILKRGTDYADIAQFQFLSLS